MVQQASAVSIGRAYELLVLAVLRRYSFQLVHSGRPGDGGVDFIGHWALPNNRVSVVGQCKCHESPLSPKDVREFESTVQRMTQPSHTTTGVLVSYSGFSQQAATAALNSAQPLILSHIRHTSNSITTSKDDTITSSSQQKSQTVTGSELNKRGLPLSQLGSSLWRHGEGKVKCLRKSGYSIRSLPSGLPDGYIRALVLNNTMTTLNPCISVVWKYGTEESRVGKDLLLLFKCPVSGSVYDLGAVSRRHLGSGEPTAWNYHTCAC